MICQVPGCEEHYACGLREKGVAIAPSATPSRINKVPPRKADPAWERGRVGEHRAGGTFMPYLDNDMHPMGVYEFQEKRSKVEAQRRRDLNAPAPA